ncbi:cupin [Actinomyces sp. W5033]|uniref:cupin n=1 Tax=Actinomyces sp. W5033 TaxID=3446479 RepID=UPI003EE0D494
MSALRAEALKLGSLPALRWTAVLTVLGAALMLLTLRQGVPRADSAPAQAVAAAMWTWGGLVQVGFLAAGVLASTKEHTSALGRTTLLVEPRRPAVWAGRLAVLTAVILPVAATLAGAALLTFDANPVHGSVEAAARTGAWLVVLAVAATGAGAALRQVLAATSVLLLLVVVAPATAQILGEWSHWLPGVAAQDWVREGAWQDGAVVLAWSLAAVVAGAVRLTRSDA